MQDEKKLIGEQNDFAGDNWDQEAIEATSEAAKKIGGEEQDGQVKPKTRTKTRIKKATQNTNLTENTQPTPGVSEAPKTERFDLKPEMKTVIKLDLSDQIAITRLGNNLQMAQMEVKLMEAKFEKVKMLFDMAFNSIISSYQVPDGWTFNLETCEFFPKTQK